MAQRKKSDATIATNPGSNIPKAPWSAAGSDINSKGTPAQWAKAAGLAWKAEVAPVNFMVGKKMTEWESRRVIYRSDTSKPLSVVSEKYKPVQPVEVLEFFRDVVGAGDFEMRACGSLRGGRRIWGLADTNLQAKIGGQDPIHGFLLLATSFDRTMGTIGRFFQVRLTCWNMLPGIIRGATTGRFKGVKSLADFRLGHLSEFNKDAAKKTLGVGREAWGEHVKLIEKLAKTKMTESMTDEYLVDVLGDPDDDVAPQLETGRLKIAKLALTNSPGSQLPTAKGTAWGALNAVTYAVTHGGDEPTANRFNSTAFGKGARISRRALDRILAYAS